jgi:hypothetical protein
MFFKLWTSSLLGYLSFLSIGAIAFLGTAESVKAQAVCSPGNGWVSQCQAGEDIFPVSDAILDLWLFDPNGGMEQKILELSGPAKVTRLDPVDAIANDPLRGGNVGIFNNYLGVIPTLLEESFEIDGLKLTGIGYGAIIEATENNIPRSDLASSFFNVFATIEGDFGKAKNMDLVHVDGDRWLVGVPPNVIPGVPEPPNLPIQPDPRCGQGANPLATIIYCGFEEVDFFLVDDNDEFILDANDNKIRVATLHGEQHVVIPPVPEASTGLSSVLIGLTGMWLLKRKELLNKV